ncbi:MAG: hypothetical protein K0R12_1213 [Gammaproteobacteria bacterium]|nr:hypothetical protein [Gammaproteobacteria bacterium]
MIWVFLFFPFNSYATTAPPDRITTPQILWKITTHFAPPNGNYKAKPIGVCYWLKVGIFTRVVQTLEVSEWQPDLVVSVFNSDGEGLANGDNPWLEAKEFIDPPARVAAHTEAKLTTGFDYSTGQNNSISTLAHYDNIRHKIVDVIGSPFMSLDYPLKLKPDTSPFIPYYQSEYDAYQERSGLAEWLSRPWDVMAFTYPIGTPASHWGYEFPRSMTVENTNNFKASLVAALRAADLVTNKNTMHTIQSVNNSCGTNCAVANVTETTSQNGEVIWQEVYPENRNITIGEDDSLLPTPLGQSDNLAGNGNYVFVLWRHYRGCIQHSGNFLFATQSIPATQKR